MKQFFSCLLCISFSLQAIGIQDFNIYQQTIASEKVRYKLEHFLQKDPDVENYYTMDDQKFVLHQGLAHKLISAPEYTLVFGSKKNKKTVKKKPTSLRGLKVAIDPGHFGGDLAKIEERFIEVKNDMTTYSFDEGTLTLFTAKWLKKLLEDEGALVMLTREKIGHGAIEESFSAWDKKQYDLKFLSLSDRFRNHFNKLDLYTRAKKINAFNPDLTIIIHYNAKDTCRDPNTNELLATDENHLMAFVGGSFLKDELLFREQRFEFMRFLITDDLEESIRLSRCVLKALEQKLHVPLRPMHAREPHIQNACIPVEDGIFCRNLAMTRLVHSPIVYGETLYQNNIDELKNLSQTDLEIDGIRGPKRAYDVATGYFEGIKAYISSTK